VLLIGLNSRTKLSIVLENPCGDGLKAFDRIRAAGAMAQVASGID